MSSFTENAKTYVRESAMKAANKGYVAGGGLMMALGVLMVVATGGFSVGAVALVAAMTLAGGLAGAALAGGTGVAHGLTKAAFERTDPLEETTAAIAAEGRQQQATKALQAEDDAPASTRWRDQVRTPTATMSQERSV